MIDNHSKSHQKSHNGMRYCLLVMIFLFSFTPLHSYALTITFISKENDKLKSELIDSTEKDLKSQFSDLSIQHVVYKGRDSIKSNLDILNNSDLIIPIGTTITNDIVNYKIDADILAAVISKANYNKIAKKFDTRNLSISALYIDQPAYRQINLIRAIIPNGKIGIIFGPSSSTIRDDFFIGSNDNIYDVVINNDDEIYNAIDEVILESRILLAIPDPIIFNRRHIKSIFLKTYRKGIPIIGFSEAYTKAGAIASVHSSLKQLSQSLSELLYSYIRNNKLPNPGHPQYFSVSTNNKVARSLGINLDSDSSLEEKLHEKE